MSNDQNMSYTDDGGLVRVQAGAPDPQAAKLPQEPAHGERESYRITVNERGEQVVETSRATRYQAGSPSSSTPPTDLAAIIASARDSAGFPISGPITGDSIVSHESLGGSGRVRDMIAAGLLPPTVLGGASPAAEQPEAKDEEKKDDKPEEEQEQQDKKDDDSPDTSLTPESKAFLIESVKRAGEDALIGVASEYMVSGEWSEATVQGFADRLGVEPAQAKEAITRVSQEYDMAAQAYAVSLGMEKGEWETAKAWAARNHPEAAMEAQQDFFFTGKVSAFKSLVQAFVKANAEGKVTKPQQQQQEPQLGDIPASESVNSVDLENDAQLGKGISEIRTDSAGVLMIFYSDGRSEPFSDARDAGRVRVSRVPRRG